MEHSALHALLLTGLVLALGGPVAVLWLLLPASARVSTAERGTLLEALLQSAARWTMWGALAAVLATFIDFFVQVAEFKGETVFGGADISTVIRFATQTDVGRLCLARGGLLLLTALATRLPGRMKWWLVAALAWGGIIATSLVSHAAAQPQDRTWAIAAQIGHITAVALWMGVLLHLFAARRELFARADHGAITFVSTVVRRFSPLALDMTSVIGITGFFAAWRYLKDLQVLFTSPYGLTLVVKLVLILPAMYAGFINFRRIGPALSGLAAGDSRGAGSPVARGVLSQFSRMLELEVTAGVLIITVAGILGSVSPPGEDGVQRLTPAQAQVFLHPHLPNTDITGWELPDDPRGITVYAMRYSEYTHNWSGLAVCVMGLAWLAQSMGGRAGDWAGRAFPFILIPFGTFIALASNPDLWILHQYSFWHALTNPILLEHQLGGVMVFILAWLSQRDRNNPPETRPLGYPLPIIMIAGSLLLLGHAHSATTVPDDLTNLINTQHAVFGACGLFAGTTRLLMMRGLLPRRLAGIAWPSFVIALGIYMAFFYREVV